ncbi:NAD(P)/FAD-dependent oxidoreductase [Candidatus Leptofilum sp.]|uniref:NAD(P)/FAD-dependent oxidoreductase n=1 Tax=Candidatus Leptofilum sp. TaxID=3241576 RepID=UPI003B5AA919
MSEAIVIGGGIVGATIAYRLVQAGAQTLLLDRADRGRATDAGAGIISSGTTRYHSELWHDFLVKAAAFHVKLDEQLRDEDAGETGYSQCGALAVAVDEEEIPLFEQASALMMARQQRPDRLSSSDIQLLEPGEAQKLFPALASVHRAYFHRQAARVDGRLLRNALLKAASQRGLVIREVSVDKLVIQSGKVTAVTAGHEIYPADSVAIAGGAWTPEFEGQLGIRIPVQPHRGQIIHLRLDDDPGVPIANWPIVHAFRDHYMLTFPGNRIVVGATQEADTGFAPFMTAGGVQEVLREALRVAPGLAKAEISELRVGLRPKTPDGLPILGSVPGLQNLFLATGHGAGGLTLGSYSGVQIADLMLGKSAETDITPFGLSRFSGQ